MERERTEWERKIAQARAYLEMYRGDPQAAHHAAAGNGDLIDDAQWAEAEAGGMLTAYGHGREVQVTEEQATSAIMCYARPYSSARAIIERAKSGPIRVFGAIREKDGQLWAFERIGPDKSERTVTA